MSILAHLCSVQDVEVLDATHGWCMCRVGDRRSEQCEMKGSFRIDKKWLLIVQARAAASGVPCDPKARRMCLNHCGELGVAAGKISGKVGRNLKWKCCHLGHTASSASLYWLSKAEVKARGVAPGSQMCRTCQHKSRQDPQQENPGGAPTIQENPGGAPRIRETHAERSSRALLPFPFIDLNVQPTPGEREAYRKLTKKFNDPKVNPSKEDGRILVRGVNGGPPLVLEVVPEVRKSSSQVQARMVRKRTNQNVSRRLSGSTAFRAPPEEVAASLKRQKVHEAKRDKAEYLEVARAAGITIRGQLTPADGLDLQKVLSLSQRSYARLHQWFLSHGIACCLRPTKSPSSQGACSVNSSSVICPSQESRVPSFVSPTSTRI
jgi:hypothetical protein